MIFTKNYDDALRCIRRKAKKIHPDIDLSHLHTLEEVLNSLPILSKADLENHLPQKKEWLHSAILFSETSGSTGNPLHTPRSTNDLTWNMLNQCNSYRRYITSGIDRVAILHPSILSPFIEASSTALKNIEVGQVRIFPIPKICDYERIKNVIYDYEITTIMSTPTLTYKLLYELKENFGSIPPSLNKLLLTGEPLSLPSINNFKRILGRKSTVVPFVYGSSEAAVLMNGRHDGMFDGILDDFLYEFKPLPDYPKRYKLIISWLKDGLMPILRYDTGDNFFIEKSDKNPIFQYIGRDEILKIDPILLDRIETTIYSIGIDVYDYSVKINIECMEIDLELVLAKSVFELNNLAYTALKKMVPEWKLNISINSSKNIFYDFSPKAKSKKIQVI